MHDTQQSLVNGDSGNGGDVGNERGNNRNMMVTMMMVVVMVWWWWWWGWSW